MVRRLDWLIGLAFAACDGGSPVDLPDAGTTPRVIEAPTSLDEHGISEAISFVVPENTRSLTVVAQGDPEALYALGSLKTADGIDHVGLDIGESYAEVMEESYFTEQIGQMPGDLYQSIRLGTFTQVYPYAPGQTLPAGPSEVRVASNRGAHDVAITLLMPEEDGASVLHLGVFTVSDSFTLSTPLSFLDEVQAIYDQAGITVVVDEVQVMSDTDYEDITDFNEPQETPTSMAAGLATLGQEFASAESLRTYFVEGLPYGVAGLSLGTPGPPLASSYYFGVLIRHGGSDAWVARVLAHEVAHFMALQHVENFGMSGETYPDPLSDTEPGEDNLMEDGTVLTEEQVFALSRSALLSID